MNIYTTRRLAHLIEFIFRLGNILFWFSLAILLCIVAWLSIFEADYQEEQNRMARQREYEKRMMLKVPAIFNQHKRTKECVVIEDKLHCTYTINGELREATYK